MSWEFCDVKHIEKTRKPHKCEFCRRVIPAGSPNIKYWAGLTDDGFQRSYACHWCEKHEDHLVDDYDDDTILDFWECLEEDIFSKELQPYRNKKGRLEVHGKAEGDYFVFYLYDTGEEVLRVKCPIIRESEVEESEVRN
jgi:hypothetical protein